ncbi:MAG: hypothetical protein ACP5N3_01970 [Candidatus Nanoarchaeia archaeon]
MMKHDLEKRVGGSSESSDYFVREKAKRKNTALNVLAVLGLASVLTYGAVKKKILGSPASKIRLGLFYAAVAGLVLYKCHPEKLSSAYDAINNRAAYEKQKMELRQEIKSKESELEKKIYELNSKSAELSSNKVALETKNAEINDKNYLLKKKEEELQKKEEELKNVKKEMNYLSEQKKEESEKKESSEEMDYSAEEIQKVKNYGSKELDDELSRKRQAAKNVKLNRKNIDADHESKVLYDRGSNSSGRQSLENLDVWKLIPKHCAFNMDEIAIVKSVSPENLKKYIGGSSAPKAAYAYEIKLYGDDEKWAGGAYYEVWQFYFDVNKEELLTVQGMEYR